MLVARPGPRKILVIKLRYIGDVLLATPVFAALRARFPDCHLTALVNPGTEGVLRHNPDLNDTWVLERRDPVKQLLFLKKVQDGRFDTVIDLTDADRSAILAYASRAPRRIGFNETGVWRGHCYTHIVKADTKSRPRIERELCALQPLGIAPVATKPVLGTSPEDDRSALALLADMGIAQSQRFVLLQPGARYWFKAWPADRFAKLADLLAEQASCRILIGGNAKERELGRQIAAQARCAPAVLSGQTTLTLYAGLLKHASLVVSNDNGLMHMAAALGTPVVALFGPSDPAEWAPYGTVAEVIYKGLDCRACFHPGCTRGEDSCMRQITVDEVFAASIRILGRRN